MRMVDIISKKRYGHELSQEEILFAISGYVKGDIPDYQMSALSMAICFTGMTDKEIAYLTDAMMHSGDIVDLSSIPGKKVDKHSTGGVGDKTSLALGPMVASCGAKLAKMSGRGLGHTGGTLDKLQSIPGFNIFISEEEMIKQVKDVGISIVGQSKNLVPADKKLYALRDVTGSVESSALIASSIMSKKLASGADCILLDVKFGNGAFMDTLKDAKELANEMVAIGKHLKRDTRAILTDMDQPLGLAVGNNLEVKEAIDTLKGHGPADFVELCLTAGSIMLVQAEIAKNIDEARKMLQKSIDDGSAFNKLCEFVKAQGGDVSYIEHPEKFEMAKYIKPIYASEDGFISKIDCLDIGLCAMRLGAGRSKMDDVIDMSAGIVLNKKVASKVKKGDVLCTIYTNKENYETTMEEVKACFKIVKEPVEKPKIIHDYIS